MKNTLKVTDNEGDSFVMSLDIPEGSELNSLFVRKDRRGTLYLSRKLESMVGHGDICKLEGEHELFTNAAKLTELYWFANKYSLIISDTQDEK